MPHTHDPKKKFKDLDKRRPPPAPPVARMPVPPGLGYEQQAAALSPASSSSSALAPPIPPRELKPTLKPHPHARAGTSSSTTARPPSSIDSSSSSSSSIAGPSSSSSSSMAGPSSAPDRARQLKEAKKAKYTHVDVNAATMQLNENGDRFAGAEAEEYAATKVELERERGPVDDRDVRFAMMQRRVEAASERRDEHGPETMGLFTAPEWALGKNLEEEDVKWYRQQFKGLSRQHPHMAIMPGTMHWQQTQKSRSGEERTGLRNTGDVFHAGHRVASVDKRKDSGDHRAAKLPDGTDATVPQFRQMWEQGRDASKGSALFDIGGVRMGYDICADASSKRVRSELNDRKKEPLDIHVINGAGQAVENGSVALKAGGIGAGSDAGTGVGFGGVAQEAWDHKNKDLKTANRYKDGELTEYLRRVNMDTSVAMSGARDLKSPEVFDPKYRHEHRLRHKLPGR